MRTKADILNAVRKEDPGVHIDVTWEEDPSYRWDGDGPEPEDLVAHDVTVRATKIVNGEMYQGEAYLGGSYSPLGGPHCPLIHGYLAQKVDEAIDNLRQECAVERGGRMTDLELFTRATIEALYFTDTGEGDQPGHDAELAPGTRADLEADCRSFWRRFGCFITCDQCECQRGNGEYSIIEQAGYDFWLTRNGHGAGFWDGDWPVYGDMLTKGSKCYGVFETYRGDDGLIYS